MTQSNPMNDAYTQILRSYNPLEIKDILIHGAALLNDELSEYVTKATIYKPNGDKITFE